MQQRKNGRLADDKIQNKKSHSCVVSATSACTNSQFCVKKYLLSHGKYLSRW